MYLNPTLKAILTVSLKNAVNAILTNAGLMTMMHGEFNFYSSNGWWNLLKATGTVVIAREAMVWGPKIIAWTTSNGGNT